MSATQSSFQRATIRFCITALFASIPLKAASPIVLDFPEHTIPPGALTRIYGRTVAGLTNLAVYFDDRKIGEMTAYPPTFGMFFTNDIPGDYQVTVRATNENGAVVSSDPVVLHYPSTAAARFIYPTNGAKLFFGEDIKIQVETILDHGELTFMRIDYPDQLGVYQSDHEPPYEFVWRPSRPGTYTFSASPWFDDAGYGEPTERLTFDIQPESVAYIIEQTEPYGPLQPGRMLYLRVSSASRGPQSYQWLRNGVPIPGATNTLYTVDHPTVADEGVYSVIIDNFAGRTSSKPIPIEIEGTRAGGTLLFSNVGLGDDARIINGTNSPFITAKLSAGPSLDQMTFYRNHAAITDGQFEGGVITLSNVPPGGKAFVQVWVERNWESWVGASKIFEITAGGEQPAPLTGLKSFQTTPNYYYAMLDAKIQSTTPTNIYAGSDTELKATIKNFLTGDVLTNLSIQWHKNGLPIPGETNDVLRLKNLQLQDAAWYSAFATDWQRIAEPGIAISVLHPLSVTATQNGELKLRANPGARYTLETSDDLKNWVFWRSLTADGEELTLPVTPSPSGQTFYRAVAEP